MPTWDDIKAAEQRLKADGGIIKTPVKHAPALAKLTGARHVWLKLENFQFTGSYKERGALNKLLTLKSAGSTEKVVAASAGNHAQGVAYHAKRLGFSARIFMPENTPGIKVARTRMHDPVVELIGADFDTAKATMENNPLAGEVIIDPFDDDEIIAGQGTVALEFLKQVKKHKDERGHDEKLDVLIIPVGGGGLLAGMAVAAKHLDPDIKIYGVEPAVAASWAAKRSGNDDKITPLGGSIAEGIYVKKVGAKNFAAANHLIEDIIPVNEEWIEQAISRLAEHERLVAEGAGAAGLAAMMYCGDRFRDKRVGLVISGGNIDQRLFSMVLTRAMVRDGRLVTFRVECQDQPGQLSQITKIIGDEGGNIISIGHHRAVTSRPAKNAEVDVEVEVSGDCQRAKVENALRRAGFVPVIISGHIEH